MYYFVNMMRALECVCVCVCACPTLHVDLPVVQGPQQGSLSLLVSEDAQQDAGQQGAVLPAHVGQSVDHVELL